MDKVRGAYSSINVFFPGEDVFFLLYFLASRFLSNLAL